MIKPELTGKERDAESGLDFFGFGYFQQPWLFFVKSWSGYPCLKPDKYS